MLSHVAKPGFRAFIKRVTILTSQDFTIPSDLNERGGENERKTHFHLLSSMSLGILECTGEYSTSSWNIVDLMIPDMSRAPGLKIYAYIASRENIKVMSYFCIPGNSISLQFPRHFLVNVQIRMSSKVQRTRNNLKNS